MAYGRRGAGYAVNAAVRSGDLWTDAPPPAGIFSGPLRAVSAGLLILVTMVAFEAMSVSAALPTAARELHGLGAYGWAFTGFLVANVVGMVTSSVIRDRRGPRCR